MRLRSLLLAAATAAGVLLPASALAAPPRPAAHGPAAPVAAAPAVAVASAVRTAEGPRRFTVSLRRRARAVIVCDVAPVVCRVAVRRGSRWEAVLPSGPVPLGLAGSGIAIHQPTAIAGAGSRFRVVVSAFHRRGTTVRTLRGRYLGA